MKSTIFSSAAIAALALTLGIPGKVYSSEGARIAQSLQFQYSDYQTKEQLFEKTCNKKRRYLSSIGYADNVGGILYVANGRVWSFGKRYKDGEFVCDSEDNGPFNVVFSDDFQDYQWTIEGGMLCRYIKNKSSSAGNVDKYCWKKSRIED